MKHEVFQNLGETCDSARLPNGLTVRVVRKPGFARKYAFLAVDFGSIDTAFSCGGETVRVPDGIAHYLEHKMFDLPDANAMNLFAAAGGSPNAFTSYGMTAYHFSCTENFEENLRTLLRMVATPYFTDESVEKERGIIAQEIRMYEDSAQSRLYEDLFGALFAHHPVRVPIAGTVESIAEITPELLYRCHRAFYRPENMVLCVVGDVEPQRVAELAQELFPRGTEALPVRDYGEAEGLLPAKKSVTRRMSVSMPTFSLGFKCPAPPMGMERMRREIIGDLAADLLAGESSRLYIDLYDRGLVDADFSAGYESIKDACLFSADGDSRDPQAVAQELLRELERMSREGFDPDAFRRLKKSALGRRMRDLDSFESICYRICAYYFDGVDYFRFPEAYASVQPEDVQSFLTDVLRPENAAMAAVAPKEGS